MGFSGLELCAVFDDSATVNEIVAFGAQGQPGTSGFRLELHSIGTEQCR
jgi:hypothetical protein